MTAQLRADDVSVAARAIAADRDNFLDCIRALAVGLVFCAHYHGLLPGGTNGVSVFFCLSGFLICRILLRIDLSLLNILKFIFRRFMRVWPMLAFQVALTVLLMWWLKPAFLVSYVPDAPGILSFTGGYSTWVGYSPAVLWTLRAEFWFYVLFPLALFVIGKRRVLELAIAGIVVGLSSKYLIGHIGSGPLAPHLGKLAVLTPMLVYLDNLMFGVLCAVLIERRSSLVRIFGHRLFLWLPVVVIVAMALDPFRDYNLRFYAETSGAALLTAFIVLHHSASPTSAQYKLVATVGRISYSIYLLHAVVLDFFPQQLFINQLSIANLIVMTTLITATILAASFLCYRGIELPAIALSKRLARFTAQPHGILQRSPAVAASAAGE